jgi:hypothetical protein
MTIRSDRGTQFVNGIINQLLGLLQIEHELSLAYSKEQNAIVDRESKLAELTVSKLADHVAKLNKVQSLIIEIARDNQLSADSFHMRESSPLSDVFPVNSYVLLKPPDGAREKLRMPEAGPYIVEILHTGPTFP